MTQPLPLVSQVTSVLWALHHSNLNSWCPEAGAKGITAVRLRTEAGFGSGPALQWGGSVQARVALFHLCSHTDGHAYTLAPASPPLANVQCCTPLG